MAGELLTTEGQIEWRGTVLGAGTPWRWYHLEGWLDLPSQRGDNAPLPGYHGAFPGRKSSEPRIVTWTFRTTAAAAAAAGGFAAAMDQLREITAPDEDPVEEPLVIRWGGESLLAQARCERRLIPTGQEYWFDFVEGVLQWETTDPRLYSPVEQSTSAMLAVPSPGGLDFGGGGLDFSAGGLDFGAGQQGGTLTATNTGHVPTWPRFEVVGPTTGPVIAYSGRQLKFLPGFGVLSGQTMLIDTRPTWHTVEIVPTGSPPGTTGVSVAQHLQVAQWTPFKPRVSTQVQFSAATYDAASRLVAKWRHAKH